MFKKIMPWILAAFLLFLPGKVQAGKEYVAERFDVDIVVNDDGSMQVTETIAFRFMGGPFTYVYRDLDKNRTDGITFTSAMLDGRTLPANGENALDWVEVQEGDPLTITWHFAPTTDQTHVFQLTYQVAGVVRKNETDDIVWMVIPPEHEYRSQASRITVSLPSGTVLASQPQLTGTNSFKVENDGNPEILTAGPVEAETPLVLTLHFTPGTLTSTAPAWQVAEAARAERAARTAPFTIGGFLIAFLGLISALLVTAYRPDPSDVSTSPEAASRLVSPPTDYKPAVAAALAARANPNLMHSLAALIDLAQRGYVAIEQMPGKWYSPNRFELVKLPKTDNLSMHEQVLMDALFVKNGQPIERVRLDQYTQLVGRRISEFSKAVKVEIGLLGLISPVRKKRQMKLLITGACLILTGFVFGIILALVVVGHPDALTLSQDLLSSALLGGCIAAFVGGLVYMIFAAFYSPLSSQGRWIGGQWKVFSKYLKDITTLREEPVRPNTFTQYLPFAAGFGLGTQWAKSFQKRGYSDVPDWFHALNAQDASASFGAFTTFMSSSDSSAASSGGGGGGASGGGGSGAG
jgi:hypothetical protein